MSAIIHPGTRTVPRGRARPIPKRRHLPLAAIAAYLILTAFLSVVFCAGGSLGGYMLAERARNQAIQAELRAAMAESSSAQLRSEIDRLKSAHSIERWASVNGFVPSYSLKDEQKAAD